MSDFRGILEIGFSLKDGDADFRLSIGELEHTPFEKMEKLRAIIPVAIHVLEGRWDEYRPDKSLATAAPVAEPPK